MGWIRCDNESSSRLHNSVNSTLRVPNDSMRDVNTPGSDSIVHQSLFEEEAIIEVDMMMKMLLSSLERAANERLGIRNKVR